MRAPSRLRLLSLSAGVAALSLGSFGALTAANAAQFNTGFRSMSIGPRAPVFHSQPNFQRFRTPNRLHVDEKAIYVGKPRGPKTNGPNANVATTNPNMGTGPTKPGRHPPGRRPPSGGPGMGPWVGPAIGIGVGTGVLIGTLGAAGATPPPPPPTGVFSGPPAARAGITLPPNNENRFVKDEVVLEFASTIAPGAVGQLLARHGLQQLEVQNFLLSNSTFVRARILDRRPVQVALRGLGGEVALGTGQANYIYRGAQGQDLTRYPVPSPASGMPRATPAMASAAATPAAGGDPAQYALTKLRLNEAHALATGSKVLVAVIDSGVDAGHPELQGVLAGTFDALGKAEKPHSHGTAMVGAIAARARLMGTAPAARILAIRAFGAAGTSAEATSFAILKGLDHAAQQNARVVNMSFAGPADPALSRSLASARARGAVLIAAAGNFGPKSPPQYPAADPSVIAVSATDANDRLFKAANIGSHIAVAAPGVDILVPAPNADYQLTSGTSVASAHVSGVAALILERRPDLTPDAVRQILLSTARDLGPRGKDDQFGAGIVDAYQAIMAVPAATAGGPAPQPATAAAR